MIDITKEQLIPVRAVPAYLQARGLGKRVHVSVVYRWVTAGVQGIRLESVRIGRTKVTSAEAIQRWVEARARKEREATPTQPAVEAAQRRREAAHHYLVDHRLSPTELDRVVEGLPAGTESTRKHVADALFRAGLRTAAQVASRTVEQLLNLPGIGAKSAPVVHELVRAVPDE